MKNVKVKDYTIGPKTPLLVMCGPCMIESEEACFDAAKQLKQIFLELDIPLVFKSSYDKANRSAHSTFRGPGLKEGLRILQRIKKELDLPIVTDVHSPEEATIVGEICDIVQIPAFLCRQTDLVLAAAKTGAVVSVKKGQFLAPWDMKNVVEKITSTGNENIILVDRGTSFGYNNLVSDMRAIPAMQSLGYPVCYDATHSVQLPGAQGLTSGGERKYVPALARAAVAAGANCLFIEAHQDPAHAKSDAELQIPIKDLVALLRPLKKIYEVIRTGE